MIIFAIKKKKIVHSTTPYSASIETNQKNIIKIIDSKTNCTRATLSISNS